MSYSTFNRVLSLLVAPALLAACDPGFAAPLEEAEELRCWPDCGVNSPKINSLEIGDVKLANATSADVKLLALESPEGAFYTPSTNVAEELVALSSGVVMYSGGQLVRWKLWFEQSGTTFSATIVDIDTVESPIPGNRSMTVYALEYLDASFNRVNVCPGHAPGEPVVTLIRGETYDRDAKLINDVGADWLTLACEREAAYKTKLLNYGPTTYTPGGAPVSSGDRDATLKMVTADYCGFGTSFTEQGTPIQWADAAGTVGDFNYSGPNPLEAYWSPYGAICLEALRRPEKAAAVAIECVLPGCDEVDLSEYEVVWVTHVPPPPPPPEEETGDEG